MVYFLFKFGVERALLISIFFILGSVYFFKQRNRRPDGLNFLTLVLALSVLVLGKLKGVGAPGLCELSLAVLFSPLLDFETSKRIAKFLLPAPFWFFVALAVGEIFSVRYGRWGILLSLVVVPIYIRDVLSSKVSEKEDEDKVQETE